MDFETNSSHYVSGRLSLWCPVCGAAEGKGCTPVKGLRFAGHDAYATGNVPRPVLTPAFWEIPIPARKPVADRPKWTPNRWVQ